MADSPRGSMAGWRWRTWFAKQLPDLKKLVSYCGAAAAAAASLLTVPEWLAPYATPAVAVVAGVLTRLALDALDYWLTDHPS